MSASKDAFTAQAERGRAAIEAWRASLPISVNDTTDEAAANLIADILHAVAQDGHDFRYVGHEAIAYAEISGAELYADGGVRQGAA